MNTQFVLLGIAGSLFFISGCFLMYGYQLRRYQKLQNECEALKVQLKMSTPKFHSSEQKKLKFMNKFTDLTYDSIIKLIESNKSVLSAVISDGMGLPIASISKNCDELATMSILFTDCELKLKRDLSIKSLDRVEFFCKNQNLSIFPIYLNDQLLYISSLSHGSVDYDSLLSKNAV